MFSLPTVRLQPRSIKIMMKERILNSPGFENWEIETPTRREKARLRAPSPAPRRRSADTEEIKRYYS